MPFSSPDNVGILAMGIYFSNKVIAPCFFPETDCANRRSHS
jgi:hydroxymethylglutaryl-CoA synthase